MVPAPSALVFWGSILVVKVELRASQVLDKHSTFKLLPKTQSVSEVGLEFLILLLQYPSPGIIGTHHHSGAILGPLTFLLEKLRQRWRLGD